MKQKKGIDMLEFIRLYMNGYSDYNMSGVFGCSISHIRAIRELEGLPSNHGIFKWQNRLSKIALEQIPDKYKYSKVSQISSH